MQKRSIIVAALITTLMGCKMFQRDTPTLPPVARNDIVATSIAHVVRNNSLSLLHDLLSEEQHVSKLLIIKRERKQLHDLIKRISLGAGVAVKSLEQIAKEDTSVNLKATDLPPGEKATREAESKAMTKQLLHSKGADFEFTLLLTQAESMNYASNLAKVAASDEPDPSHRKELMDLSEQLYGFYQEVVQLIRRS